MGYALIWAEGLAVALVGLALATAWAARGRAVRGLWAALVYLVFFGAAAAAVLATFEARSLQGGLVRTTWFPYSLTWLVAFALLGVSLMWSGLRRAEPGVARTAATWPRRQLWLGFGAAVLALGLTLWNVDLSARAELAIARQEAGAVLLAMTPPAVPESENAARLYAEAARDFGEPLREPWRDAVFRGIDAPEPVDWKGPAVAARVKPHQDALALLRKAAGLRGYNFDYHPGPLDAVTPSGPQTPKLGFAVRLLALDARVRAAEGDLKRAFEDVTAILGIFRHLSGYPGLAWGQEVGAWRTLEDVLRLAPPGKEPLPSLDVPELFPLVRKVREEHALLGMVMPVAASQPSLVTEEKGKHYKPVEAFLIESVGAPAARLLVIPDELVAMRKMFDDYQRSPRKARDETPKDWADLRKAVESDPTSLYGAIYVKPKHQVLLAEGSALAALRETARTGLAVAAYQRKHGRYPERIEQLVPEFVAATPTDPRDGQVLRVKRVGEVIVVYAPQDAAAVEGGKVRDAEARRPAPIFRLYPRDPAP